MSNSLEGQNQDEQEAGPNQQQLLNVYIKQLLEKENLLKSYQTELNRKLADDLKHALNMNSDEDEPSESEQDSDDLDSTSSSSLEKRAPNSYLRFGKRNGPAYLRFGRAQAYLRFGKRSPNSYLRFGKRNPAYLRFGRK